MTIDSTNDLTFNLLPESVKGDEVAPSWIQSFIAPFVSIYKKLAGTHPFSKPEPTISDDQTVAGLLANDLFANMTNNRTSLADAAALLRGDAPVIEIDWEDNRPAATEAAGVQTADEPRPPLSTIDEELDALLASTEEAPPSSTLMLGSFVPKPRGSLRQNTEFLSSRLVEAPSSEYAAVPASEHAVDSNW